MRIKDFLNDNNLNDFLRNSLDVIYEDCNRFLNESGILDNVNNFLYRGIKNYNRDFELRRGTRQDRRPVDMPKYYHDLLNELMEERYGIKFRNSVFVSNNKRFAEYYGDVFYVFPKGKYNYLWSIKYRDLFNVVSKINMNYKRSGYSNVNRRIKIEYDLQKMLDDYMFNEGIKTFLTMNQSNEMMLDCEKYYILKYKDEKTEGLILDYLRSK